MDLNPYRAGRRFQELVFDLAADLVREYKDRPKLDLPTHVLFPQVVGIVERYLREKVKPVDPANLLDVFLSPYYGLVIERLVNDIHGDTSQGEAPEVPRYEASRGPGSTDDVDFWTSKKPREAVRCHLNYVVPDTERWEQSAAYYIDTHPATGAFVKNQGLGFAIPYFHNGQPHDYAPDFIVRLKSEEPSKALFLILEVKGFDPLAEVKAAAAQRWCRAVNADGKHGHWHYATARSPEEARAILNQVRDGRRE